jgi:hypothetical protein
MDPAAVHADPAARHAPQQRLRAVVQLRRHRARELTHPAGGGRRARGRRVGALRGTLGGRPLGVELSHARLQRENLRRAASLSARAAARGRRAQVASGVVALARIEAARAHLIRQRLGLCARELRVLVAPLELCAELAVLLVHAPHVLDLRPKARHARRH